MEYTVKHSKLKRESFGEYVYDIFKNDKLVAHYWHDYRGDDHGIKLLNGEEDSWPVGRMTDFLKGGGPKPTVLSPEAISYLENRLY
tara:strand:- start:108 stop:365 length:258 start_codon:yes stop_codon:yes gene_type:complete